MRWPQLDLLIRILIRQICLTDMQTVGVRVQAVGRIVPARAPPALGAACPPRTTCVSVCGEERVYLSRTLVLIPPAPRITYHPVFVHAYTRDSHESGPTSSLRKSKYG